MPCQRIQVSLYSLILGEEEVSMSRDSKKIFRSTVKTLVQQEKSVVEILSSMRPSIHSDPGLFINIIEILNSQIQESYKPRHEDTAWFICPRQFLKTSFHVLTCSSHQLWWYAGYGIPAATDFLIKNKNLDKTEYFTIQNDVNPSTEVIFSGISKLGFFIFGLFAQLDPSQSDQKISINSQLFEPKNFKNAQSLLQQFPNFLEQTVCIINATSKYFSEQFPMLEEKRRNSDSIQIYPMDVVKIAKYNLKKTPEPDSALLKFVEEVENWFVSDFHLTEHADKVRADIHNALVTIPPVLLNIIYEYLLYLPIKKTIKAPNNPESSPSMFSSLVNIFSALFRSNTPSAVTSGNPASHRPNGTH
jgi:hypothetical protein